MWHHSLDDDQHRKLQWKQEINGPTTSTFRCYNSPNWLFFLCLEVCPWNLVFHVGDLAPKKWSLGHDLDLFLALEVAFDVLQKLAVLQTTLHPRIHQQFSSPMIFQQTPNKKSIFCLPEPYNQHFCPGPRSPPWHLPRLCPIDSPSRLLQHHLALDLLDLQQPKVRQVDQGWDKANQKTWSFSPQTWLKTCDFVKEI